MKRFSKCAGDRHIRRVMVFMSVDNPLWERIALFERKSGQVVRTAPLKPGAKGEVAKKPASKPYQLLGASRTKCDQWRDGRAPNVASAYNQIAALAVAIRDVTKTERKDLEGEARDLNDVIQAFLAEAAVDSEVQLAGKALGFADRDAMRMALDRAFHRLHPLFRSPFMGREAGAKEELRRIKGRHDAWMRRGPDLFLHCVLDFRYVCKLPEGHCIRVRLDLPMIHGGAGSETAADAIYEGWVMVTQATRLFLCLEARHSDSSADCIFMVIDKWQDDAGWRAGHYLTAGQDNSGLPASDLVLLHSVPKTPSAEAPVARIVRPGDPLFDTLTRCGERKAAGGDGASAAPAGWQA